MIEKPNVLVIMTDQERYPTPYEDAAVAAYRRDRLPGQQRLRETGVEFHSHTIASSACLPSRTTLFTGQYPTLHGVRNTDGLAKRASDPAMVWLDPDTVPTMGDWFRAAGYRTEYRGKWHLSHPDLPAGNHRSLLTNDRDGNLISEAVEAYRRANRLASFGFDGWVGAEPHGPLRENSGFVRDEIFAEQVTSLFGSLAQDRSTPWLTVASLVNPHDIVFAPPGWEVLGFPPVPDDVPSMSAAPSQTDPLTGRPHCHGEYRDAWTGMVYPQPLTDDYRRLYLWLHHLADRATDRMLGALDEFGFTDTTIVVFTSDHGELLGAHSGLQQKWHNSYAETVHVPLLISGPGIEHRAEGVRDLTSHIDLLPTVLSLVGVDTEAAAAALAQTHVETRPLVGRDVSATLSGGSIDGPVYFMTNDQISRGLRTTNVITDKAFEAVSTNPLVEAVVVDDADGRWKLTRYHAGHASEPDQQPWEWQLHELRTDPEERADLGTSHSAFGRLAEVLRSTSSTVALEPSLAR